MDMPPFHRRTCAIDLMKEPLQRTPVVMDLYTVASLDDMVGMKVAALHGRGLPRDLIDVCSTRDLYGFADLERLGALFEDGFCLQNLAFRLETGLTMDNPIFMDYGLNVEQVQQLRRFALDRYTDLSLRLAEADIAPDP